MQRGPSVIVLIFICLTLFFIPFLWLKPGEMDIGGDTSRLYFYDPLSYLFQLSFFGISPSGIGGETISYYGIPFISYLALLKSFSISSTVIISIHNGFSLSCAFISMFLVVKELLTVNKFRSQKKIVFYSSIIASLFYIFSPTLILGWDKAILTHDQIFLNPLMFFLLLKFFLTYNKLFLFSALLLSLLFAHNFDYVAAPPFFSFYPLSLAFLFLYIRFIRNIRIRLKDILLGIVLFFLLHAFHLLPHIISLLEPGTNTNTAVFSDSAKFTRGLEYFSAVARSVKVSFSLMILPQMMNLGFLSYAFIIFPIIILVGFLLNKQRLYLLTGIFFLITLFFVSANITNVGLAFYKSLFDLPGFSMFRNFFGQWVFVFTFFYALLLGQALVFIFEKVKKSYSVIMGFTIIVLLFSNAWVFINGSLFNKIHYQSKNVKITSDIDPEYEQVLDYIRNLKVDGKFISFPLTGPGYQIIAGTSGGAYQGPSTISYLAGKNDFTGYDGLIPFNEIFFELVRNNDINGINRLFSILNIKYIFYNSDPKIYDTSFPQYPYDYVRDVMPKDQKSYQRFLQKLPIKKVKEFGGKYHIYEVDNYLPHIYVADNFIYASDTLTPYFVLDLNDSLRSVVFTSDTPEKKDSSIILEAVNSNPLLELINNYHLHVHDPFISRRMDDLLYPIVTWREKNSLKKKTASQVEYLDFSLLYLAKRIGELEKYYETPVTHKEFSEPKIFELNKWKSYYSWEASLSRIETDTNTLIDWVENSGWSESSKKTMKIKINENLTQHEKKLTDIIRKSNYSENDKKYLSKMRIKIFDELLSRVNLQPYDVSSIAYDLEVPKGFAGEYIPYLKAKNANEKLIPSDYELQINGTDIKQNSTQSNTLIKFPNIQLKEGKTTIYVKRQPINISNLNTWLGVGKITQSVNETIFEIDNQMGPESGFSQEIPSYDPSTQYAITYEYLTEGEDFLFRIFERQKDTENKLSSKTYFDRNINSKKWTKDQVILTSSPESVSGFMQFISNTDKYISKLHIKNLTIVEVPDEKLLFSKIASSSSTTQLPKIHFEKVNPTFYKIKVFDASTAYNLVFSESYSSKWKLYEVENKLIKNTIDTAKYFNGEITEGSHTNKFFDPSIFTLTQSKPIAEDRHVSGNGYANVWEIMPAEVGNKQNYEFALVFEPQKNFYIYFVISSITALSIIIFLIFYKRNEKK